jgi:hypothetical protein
MAMMATTTASSINVKPLLAWRFPVTLIRTFQGAIANAHAPAEQCWQQGTYSRFNLRDGHVPRNA